MSHSRKNKKKDVAKTTNVNTKVATATGATQSPIPHLTEALHHVGTGPIANPAVKARLLAAQLKDTADLLEKQLTEASNELAAPVAMRVVSDAAESVHRAWRAFHGLTLERHQRLVLIACVQWANEVLGHLDTTKPMGDRGGRARILSGMARDRYAIEFPELASRLGDLTKLEVAILAWSNKAGRPTVERPSPSKWIAINDVAVAMGLRSASPASIRREWERYSSEVIMGNMRVSEPHI